MTVIERTRFTVPLAAVAGLLWALTGVGSAGCNKNKQDGTTPRARASGSSAGSSSSAGSPAAREGGSAPAAAEGGSAPAAREGGSAPAGAAPGEAGPRRAGWTPPRPRGLAKPPPLKLMTMAQLRQLLQSGRYDQAIKEARKILGQRERDVPAMAVMAEAYFRKKEYELCRAVLDTINEQQKDHPLYLYLSGRIYLHEKNYSLARQFFEKAVQKNPRLLDAWTVIGVRYLEGGNYQKALSALLKAKALPGGNTYAMNLNIGSCYRALAHRNKNIQHLITALNYYNEAEKLYRQAPGHSNRAYLKAIYNKAILYLDAKVFPGLNKIQRLERGIALMQQYVTLAPRYSAKTWYQEKKAVMKILNKAKNVDLPAAKAMAQAKAAQQPRPAPRRTAPRQPPPR